MKKILSGTIILALALGLTGCGNNTDEVAKDFVLALSSADMEDAKELASEKVIERIDSIQKDCNTMESRELAKQTRAWSDKVKVALNDKDHKEEYRKKIKELEAEYLKEREEVGKEVKEIIKSKTSSSSQMTAELRAEIENITYQKLYPAILEMTEDRMALSGVKAENQDELEKVFAWAMLKETSFEQAAQELLEKNPVKFTPECVDKASDFGFIDDINVLEVKELSADEELVRLELVKKKGKSNKVDMHVEKIKGDWLVSDY